MKPIPHERGRTMLRRVALGLALVAAASATPALAQSHGGHAGGGGSHFSGGGHFAGGGHWGGGRWGWGWGPGWGWGVGLGLGWPYYWDPYWYGASPYYDYYPPTYTAVAPAVQAPAPIAPQAQSWYYCASPKGYYPYVQSCNGPWRPVPATPPGAQ